MIVVTVVIAVQEAKKGKCQYLFANLIWSQLPIRKLHTSMDGFAAGGQLPETIY